MENISVQYMAIIIFLHVASAVVWIGGMISIRFAVHYSLSKIEDPVIRLGRNLELLKRFFDIVKYLVVVLLITAIVMIINFKFKGGELYGIVIIKEILWTIMTLIFIYIYILRYQAQKYFEKQNFKQTKIKLSKIPSVLIPINITLGLIAIYLGVSLRGF